MGSSGSSGISHEDHNRAMNNVRNQIEATRVKQAAEQAKILKEMQEQAKQARIEAEKRAIKEREAIRLSEKKEREELQRVQAQNIRKLRKRQEAAIKLQQERIEQVVLEQEREKKRKEKLQNELNEMKEEIENEKDPNKLAEIQVRNFKMFIRKITESRGLIDKYDYKGKNIGIIGITSVGKTTLLRILTKHKIGVVDKGEATITISKIAECEIVNKQIIYKGEEKSYYNGNEDILDVICNIEGEEETKYNKQLNIWDTPGLNDKVCYFKPEILAHFNSLQLAILMYTNTPLSILHPLLTLKALGIPFIIIKSKADMYEDDAFGDDESSLEECVTKDEYTLCGSIGYRENIYTLSAANVYKNKKLTLGGHDSKYDEFNYKQIHDIIVK